MGDEMIALEDPTSASNLPIKNFMLKRGITWAEEFNKLKASVTDNGTIPLANVTSSKLENDVGIWYMRISLRIIEQYYMVGSWKRPLQMIEVELWYYRLLWERMPRLIPVLKP
jgi:hypothetical protein